MLVIHRDQVEAFAAQRREDFVRTSAAYLGKLVGRGVPIEAVRASTERALARRIATEPEVLQWIALEQIAGGPLDERWPWAEDILSTEHLSAAGKLRVLVRTAAQHGHDVAAIDLLGAWKP
jgi:hypothetical protein